MKKSILYFIAILFLTSCEKEASHNLLPEQENQTNQTATTRSPAAKIDICHHSGSSNTWQIININENAWQAHEGHGDVRLDDQDGDGFVPDNACGYGEMGDCDDTNAAINPNATEVCDNEVDDDCDGDIDEADSDCEEGGLQVIVDTGTETYTLYVHPTDNASFVKWSDYNLNVIDLADIITPANALSDFNG